MKVEILSIETVEKIASLEKRIKELETINEDHSKLNGNLRTANNTLCEAEEFMYNQAKDYKTKKEKAVKWIKDNIYTYKNDSGIIIYDWDSLSNPVELLNILQGSDE